MRQLTDSEKKTLEKHWLEHLGNRRPKVVDFDWFEAGFTTGLDYAAEQLAALTAERDGLRAAVERMRAARARVITELGQIATNWHDYANEDYCTITNPGTGDGLRRAANHLQRYINEARRALEPPTS